VPRASGSQLLIQLASTSEPLAGRFDDGPPLSGRVAVLPAAFNPPTLAHAHLLALAAREPDVDGAGALLTTRNVDKDLHGATFEQRLEMLLALAATQPLAVLATNQARLADQSLALVRSLPGVTFDFVVGYDTLVRLFDDRYYTDMSAELAPFFARHRLIATNRAQHSVAEVERFVRAHPQAAKHADRILIRAIDDAPASYSSTASRDHAATGADLAQLPPPVAEYIRSNQLYRSTAAQVDSPSPGARGEGAGG
jgi:nicotinic acid mononucleotide adenylyltransferase